MADGIVGQQFTERFRTASAGESFTISGATKPDGSAWSGPAITDLGSASYRLSFTPDVEGVWEATLTGNTSGEVLVGEWDIAAVDTGVVGVASSAPSITRLELRSRIAQHLGDRTALRATDAGTDTTFIDTLTLGAQLENPTHRHMVFTSGSNLGLVRRITIYNSSTSTITVNAALTVATAAGQTAEVYNWGGRGFSYDDYNTVIAAVHDAAQRAYMVPYQADVAADFDADSPVLTIPDGLVAISRVEYLDTNGDYQLIQGSASPSGWGWELDPYGGTITVRGGSYLYLADGLTVRLSGAGREEPLTSDTSTTTVNPDWFVTEACARLAMQLYIRGRQEMYNPALVFQQDADRIRPRSRGTMRAVRSI